MSESPLASIEGLLLRPHRGLATTLSFAHKIMRQPAQDCAIEARGKFEVD